MGKLKIFEGKNNYFLIGKKNIRTFLLKKPLEIEGNEIIIDDFCIIITKKEFKQQNNKWYKIFIQELNENPQNFIEIDLNNFDETKKNNR